MIQHHPAPETLLAYSAGTLPAGRALVVMAHLQGCPHCQAEAATLDALGGALLETLTPEPLAPDAFARTLAQLDTPAPPAPRRQTPLPQPFGLTLPAALHGTRIGRWLWLGRGLRYSRVRLPWAPEANVMLLRVAPNRRVITHSHGGAEFTQVLHGGFYDATGHYEAGDLAEADEHLSHQPCAGPQGCICLAALEGGLRLPW